MSRGNRQSAVSLTYGLYFSSVGAFLPFIALYLNEAGWSGAAIGLYIAIGPLVTFLTQPLWGLVGDLWGDLPKLFAVLMLASGVCVGIFALLPVSSWFLLLAVLIGLFQGPLVAMLDSMSVRILGEKRTSWGNNRLWGSLGFAAVSYGVGIVFSSYPWIPFVGYALGAALTALAAFTLPFDKEVSDEKATGVQFKLTDLAQVLKGPFLSFLIATFLIQLGHYTPANLLSLVMADRGAASTIIGLAWSITALIEVPVFLVTTRLLRKHTPEKLLTWAAIINTLRLALFGLTQNPLLMILIHALKGFAFATILVSLVLIVDRLIPKEYHATGFTVHTALAVTLPQLLGGLVGGQIYDLLGGAGLFFISALLSLLGTVAFMFWKARSSQKRSARRHSS